MNQPKEVNINDLSTPELDQLSVTLAVQLANNELVKANTLNILTQVLTLIQARKASQPTPLNDQANETHSLIQPTQSSAVI
jgi:hypothetical protein